MPRYDRIWPPGGHFVAIFMSLTHNFNVPALILFKLGIKAVHYDIQMHVNLFRDTIENGGETGILLQFFRVFEP